MIKAFKRPSAGWRKRWIPRALGALVLLASLFAFESKPTAVEQLGNLLFDRYQTWKPREWHPDVPVRVVDIDNESIARIGQWPWSRLTMARLNDRLNEAGAGVIAYDIIFSESDRTSPANLAPVLAANPTGSFDASALEGMTDHDTVFAASLADGQAVLAYFLTPTPNDVRPASKTGYGWAGDDTTLLLRNYGGTLPAIPILGEAASAEGVTSLRPERDGIVRLAPLFQRVGDAVQPSLSMEALRVVQQATSHKIRGTDGHGEMGAGVAGIAAVRVGQFDVVTDADANFRVYYTDPVAPRAARTTEAWRILDPDVTTDQLAETFGGSIVFIGTSADGLKDLAATPVASAYDGVQVHAEIIEQIIGQQLHGNQLLTRPYWTEVLELWMILLPGLILIIVLPMVGAGKGAAISTAAIAGIAAFSWQRFSGQLVLINPVYPMLSITATYLVMTIASFWLTESERSRIRGAFDRYLSPTMVAKVSDDPSLLTLGGEERPMTILFLDIRSFSKISEAMEPQEIVTFLNLFLTPMTEALQARGATIDKYIGDAIVAFWNAPLDDPDHASNACAAVLDMSQELVRLREQYDDQDEVKWPDNLSMGVGLNTGICCVGNLGSAQRFSYSMIGDAANLASRIEGLTKQYRVEALVGSATAEQAPQFALLEADLIRVVGRQTPERIFILAGDAEMAASDGFKALAAEHDRMIEAYRAQDWDAANNAAEAAQALAGGTHFEGYYDVIRNRVADYRNTPPDPGWDGVFTATSK